MSMYQYYERLQNILEDDVDHLLTEPDPAKRDPKIIMNKLKLMQECEDILNESRKDETEINWEKLSPTAQTDILKIIQRDLGVDA